MVVTVFELSSGFLIWLPCGRIYMVNAPSPERQSGVVQMLVGVKPRKHVPVPTYLVEMCHERHCGFLEINHAGTEKREDRGKSCAA